MKTSHHSYLGLEIQDDGKWSKHVENCTKKANRALGFIRRNFGRCPESIKETLYTGMVRPHLEYASAWGTEPSSQKGYKQTRKHSKEGFQICKKLQ